MVDVTECPPDTIAAHMARLSDLREVIEHVLDNEFRETPEARLSGKQLAHPFTLRDYLACMEITRNSHRAPSFVGRSDSELSEINHKLDLIAGLLQKRGVVDECLNDGVGS